MVYVLVGPQARAVMIAVLPAVVVGACVPYTAPIGSLLGRAQLA